jgi:acetyl/propionyl-CoA carboxylase alpha subunit
MEIRRMTLNMVLVANRGEIAIRILRACHQLGLNSVAIYSDSDREAPFVSLADQAFHLGGSDSRDSYLNVDKILDVAKKAGADAIHPGYGFLAENASFAQRCLDAGLTYIGPSPKIIAEMGSKIKAKAAAEKAGVSVVPGYHSDEQSDKILLAEAAHVGLPLLIKASAGGGGRGMRRVNDLNEFMIRLQLARKEAKSAFGDGAVLLERYIENARHIEVQVLADGSGAALHLYERDCSIQRNHQKLIEEAPAPNLPDEVRTALLEAAVRLTRSINYNSLGTVEFLYDPKAQDFFFIEMNTRLQVEHPVTELVTGIDLVEWQIRIAAGENIPFTQDDITCTGWAMEARVSAEDASNGFCPQTGTLILYNEPTGKNIRIDSGVKLGSLVSHYYDSMLSKVIVNAQDRNSAICLLNRALSNYQIGGVGTNIAFLSSVLATDAFQNAKHHNALISTEWPDGWGAPPVTNKQVMEAAIAFKVSQQAKNKSSPWQLLGAWRITQIAGLMGTTTLHVRYSNRLDYIVSISGHNGSYAITVDKKSVFKICNVRLKKDILSYEINSHRQSISVQINKKIVILYSGSNTYDLKVLTSEQALLGSPDKQAGIGNIVAASMPGLVVEVRVTKGERVEAGQTLIVLEAMKMLQNLTAPRMGVVKSVRHQVGDTVTNKVVLITLEPIN